MNADYAKLMSHPDQELPGGGKLFVFKEHDDQLRRYVYDGIIVRVKLSNSHIMTTSPKLLPFTKITKGHILLSKLKNLHPNIVFNIDVFASNEKDQQGSNLNWWGVVMKACKEGLIEKNYNYIDK